ncbi:PIG-L deacetylase family protein [Clostridium paridis]|uniref:PIG-L family deacetylase n=1 Tax=Clostridium paridis TaxID=2803863 RepID=A0A937FI88_9CLOT|nr:PIG-L family deacetylase [Clostridium paridis]MBL4933550.1 PIG-L family deacetylase [Clostridium paridis]
MKNILVIAAHPDDEILGVGATVAKHVNNGDRCFALVLGEGITSRYENKNQVNNIEVEDLHKDANGVAKIIGYEDLYLENLPDNRFDSLNLLDIIKVIEAYLNKLKPDIIYTHHGGDLNIDHKKIYEAVLTATRPINKEQVKEIYCFETVSSTEWNFEYKNSFRPNYFVDVTETLNKKLKAMKYYKSEIRDFPHPRSLESLVASAKVWGSVIGVKYAEAFEVVRIIT